MSRAPTFPYPDFICVRAEDEFVVYAGELQSLPPEIAARIRLGDPLIGVALTGGRRVTWHVCEILEATNATLVMQAHGELNASYDNAVGEAKLCLWLVKSLDPNLEWVTL